MAFEYRGGGGKGAAHIKVDTTGNSWQVSKMAHKQTKWDEVSQIYVKTLLVISKKNLQECLSVAYYIVKWNVEKYKQTFGNLKESIKLILSWKRSKHSKNHRKNSDYTSSWKAV